MMVSGHLGFGLGIMCCCFGGHKGFSSGTELMNFKFLFLISDLFVIQVSCELTEPQMSRPNEGVLRVEVDFSGMAGPIFAEGRNMDFQEESVELQRLMEVEQ